MSNSNHPVSGSDKHASTYEAFKASLLARKVTKSDEVAFSLRHSDDAEVTKSDEDDFSLRHSPVLDSFKPAISPVQPAHEVTKCDEDIKLTGKRCLKDLSQYLRQSSSPGDEVTEDSAQPLSDGFAVAEEESLLPLPPLPVEQVRTKNFDGASDEVAHSLRHTSSLGMPMPPLMVYAEIQLFKNAKPVSKKQEPDEPKNAGRTITEWTLKISVATAYDTQTDQMPPMDNYFITLSSGGPRRLRARIKEWIEAGQLSPEFLHRFNDTTRNCDPDIRMGLVSAKGFEGYKPPKGVSTKAKRVTDDQFGMLEFSPDGTPGTLTLWLAQDQEPMTFKDWTTPTGRTLQNTIRHKRAAKFITYYDPDQRFWKMRQDARALEVYLATQKSLIDYRPENVIASIIVENMIAFVNPLIEDNKRIVRENNSLRQDVNTLLQARNDQDTINVHLAQCIAELQANLTRP